MTSRTSTSIEINNKSYRVSTEEIPESDTVNVIIKRSSEIYTCEMKQSFVKRFSSGISKEHGMLYTGKINENEIIIKIEHPILTINDEHVFTKKIIKDEDKTIQIVKELKHEFDMVNGLPLYRDMLGPCCTIDIPEQKIDVKTAKEFFSNYTDTRNFPMYETDIYTPTAKDTEQYQINYTMFNNICSEYVVSYAYQKTEPIVGENQFCVQYEQHSASCYLGYKLNKTKDLWTVYTLKSDVIDNTDQVGKVAITKSTNGVSLFVSFNTGIIVKQSFCDKMKVSKISGNDTVRAMAKKVPAAHAKAKRAPDTVISKKTTDIDIIVCSEKEWLAKYYICTIPFDLEDGYYNSNHSVNMLCRDNKIYFPVVEDGADNVIVKDNNIVSFSLQNIKMVSS